MSSYVERESRRVDAAWAASRASGVAPLIAAGVVVLGFALFAALYAILLPLGQPIDEPSHLGYVRLIADHRALPSAVTPEKQQPPLYYLLAAGMLRGGVPEQALRSLTVLLGAATIVVTMLVARALMPGHPWRAVVAGAFVAGIPIAQASSGALSNDPLAWLSGALILLLLVIVSRDPEPSTARALAVGVVLGVALLSKETVWVLCALLLGVVVWRWWGRWNWRLFVSVTLPPLLIAGWWFARNLATFHRPTPPLSPITTQNQYLRHFGQLRAFISETVRSISGPETTTGLIPRSDWAAALTWLLAAFLVVLSVAVCLRLATRYGALSSADRVVVATGSLAVLLAVGAFVANSVLVDLQPQVRYLIVVAAIPAAAWAAVLAVWLRDTVRQGDRRIIVAGLAVFAVAVLALDVDSLRTAASLH